MECIPRLDEVRYHRIYGRERRYNGAPLLNAISARMNTHIYMYIRVYDRNEHDTLLLLRRHCFIRTFHSFHIFVLLNLLISGGKAREEERDLSESETRRIEFFENIKFVHGGMVFLFYRHISHGSFFLLQKYSRRMK